MSEANERDHKKLGKELELFTFSDTVGKGLPLWLPKGATVRRELERFIGDEEIRRRVAMGDAGGARLAPGVDLGMVKRHGIHPIMLHKGVTGLSRAMNVEFLL